MEKLAYELAERELLVDDKHFVEDLLSLDLEPEEVEAAVDFQNLTPVASQKKSAHRAYQILQENQ